MAASWSESVRSCDVNSLTPRGTKSRFGQARGVHSTGFLTDLNCAPTVHESNVFIPFGLLLSEKQIPRFVGNVNS